MSSTPIDIGPAQVRVVAQEVAGHGREVHAAASGVRSLPALSGDTAAGPAMADFRAVWSTVLGVLADDCRLCASNMSRAADRWESTEHAIAGVHPGGIRPS